MLQHKELLYKRKNLLAFSAGGDSTALLFLLLQENIEFDIAIVDYGLREQSKEEIAYAQALAKKHGFTCFLHQAKDIQNNFEAKAREIRYSFFEELIYKYKYDNLLTAHHLGDRFEWMLMQFCKGAGCVEIAGMKAYEKRESYMLLRPLLQVDKQELLEYLHKNKIHYFEDVSNRDEKYTRNSFRKHYSEPLLKKYRNGIRESFNYIDEDVSALITEIQVHKTGEFVSFMSHSMRSNIYTIDKYFKSIGKILTAKERKLLQEETTIVIARKYVVNRAFSHVFIAPYIKEGSIDKKLKEKFRKLKIEPKLRAYLAKDSEALEFLSLLLE